MSAKVVSPKKEKTCPESAPLKQLTEDLKIDDLLTLVTLVQSKADKKLQEISNLCLKR